MKLRLLGVALLIAGLGASGADRTAQRAAMLLYRQARQAELAGDRTRAYILYSQAAAKDPENRQAWARAQALKPVEATVEAKTEDRKNELPLPFSDDIFGTATADDLARGRRILPPTELKGREGTRDFDLRGLDSKQAFELVAKAFGLEPVFDSTYEVKTNLRVRLTDADYRDALRSVEAATDSFVIPINSRLFLVANETTQKRSELDAVTSLVIPAPEPFSIQDLQEIATAVRGTLDVQKLFVDSARRLIVIRDRSSKVRLAQKLVLDVMKPRAEVAVDVELLATDQSSSLTYGMSLPTSFQLAWLGHGQSLSASIGGLGNALGIGGGKSYVGLGLTNASLFGSASKSNSRTLLRAQVVATDGTPASLHVGDRYPIQANSYLGTTAGKGTTFSPPPSVNFEDLGLLLKVTPRVHDGGDVTLEIEAEFKLLGSQSVDNIPVISNRKFQSKVRVGDGEWAVLAGLMTDSDGITVTGMPGLSLLPLLRKNTRTVSHGETLIVFKPRLLNVPAAEAVTKPAWVGTESHPRPAM